MICGECIGALGRVPTHELRESGWSSGEEDRTREEGEELCGSFRSCVEGSGPEG